MNFKGSETEQKLKDAFAGEAQAHIKYKFYAQKARDEGLDHVAAIFEETARNEYEHALRWFKYLNDGDVPTTIENLNSSSGGEHEESTEMYDEFSKIAKDEGFLEISKKFKYVDNVESRHEMRFTELMNNLTSNEMFEREDKVVWECELCGMQVYGKEAPEVCPLCGNDQGHYSIKVKNY